MGVGTTLQDMERQLRLETGASLSSVVGAESSEGLRMRLKLEQEKLYDEHDWRGFGVVRDIPVEAGQAFVEVPSTLHLAKTTHVYVKDAFGWNEIMRGFDTRDEAGLYAGQGVSAWDFVSNADFEPELENSPAADVAVFFNPRIQLFPSPATDITLRIEGYRRLRRLTQADDRCELDDQLIVLHAAAAILGREDNLRYKVVRAAARDRLLKLQEQNNRYGRRVFAMPTAPDRWAPRLPRPRR